MVLPSTLHWSCWHIVSSNLMPLWSAVYILMSIQSESSLLSWCSASWLYVSLPTFQISCCAWTLRQLSRNWQSSTEVNHISNKSQSNRVKIHLARYVECSSKAGKYEIQSVQSFLRRKMTLFWSSASHAFTQFYFSPFCNAQHILRSVSAAGWDTWIWWSNAWKCTTSSRDGKPCLRDYELGCTI